MKKDYFLLMMILVIVTSCTTSVQENKKCAQNSDCVPATCCHANETINKNYAKVCNVMCTQECRPHTLDCGQGEIQCVQNGCQVILK